LGNIKSSVRNKPSNRAWVLVAYLPITHFENPKALQTTLQDRLFHQCVELVLSPLIAAGTGGVKMVDSCGHERDCFPRIAAYLADYPEQILVNVAAHRNSPTSTASYKDLGNDKPCPPRTQDWILNVIAEVKASVDPSDLEAYQKAAKLRGLNGVDRPFWIDLPGYRPELCICPDILHGLHPFWRDHVLKWVINLVGIKELDARVKAVEPVIGMKHFKRGISHLSQWTGKEDRELQRILLAVIAGAPNIDTKTMTCLRAFHDFVYLAQYQTHGPETLRYLKQALQVFHRTKDVFITKGARRGKNGTIKHYCIPKMAALFQYVTHIPAMGSSPQYSTEWTENCHQTMAKQAYRATNKRDFEYQMCRYLDRTDRIALLEEITIWWDKQQKINKLEESIKDRDPAYQELARSFLDENVLE
ncbi:4030_t:CDS:1, partial [Acaulospora colombiana]